MSSTLANLKNDKLNVWRLFQSTAISYRILKPPCKVGSVPLEPRARDEPTGYHFHAPLVNVPRTHRWPLNPGPDVLDLEDRCALNESWCKLRVSPKSSISHGFAPFVCVFLQVCFNTHVFIIAPLETSDITQRGAGCMKMAVLSVLPMDVFVFFF